MVAASCRKMFVDVNVLSSVSVCTDATQAANSKHGSNQTIKDRRIRKRLMDFVDKLVTFLRRKNWLRWCDLSIQRSGCQDFPDPTPASEAVYPDWFGALCLQHGCQHPLLDHLPSIHGSLQRLVQFLGSTVTPESTRACKAAMPPKVSPTSCTPEPR